MKKNVFEEGQVLLFDKPVYWTSFDLVNKVRIMIRESLSPGKLKVGHAGTLDPLAGGLMILCTGRATKKINDYTGMDKEYVAEITFGHTTQSYDLETEIDGSYPVDHITEEMIRQVLEKFLGEQEQIPPAYSAKLVKGKRLYEFARKGIIKKMEPVKVIFREIELIGYSKPVLKVRIVCSKGTYIRSFANDLGKALVSGAYLSSLTRTAIGPFRLEEAMTLEKFRFFLEQMKQNK